MTNEDAAAYMGDERVGASDLLPGTYEGGFKLWECSLDLCKYLVTSYKVDPATLLSLPEVACDLRVRLVGADGCGGGGRAGVQHTGLCRTHTLGGGRRDPHSVKRAGAGGRWLLRM